ncbi:hypothetical protein X777_10545 [Ooceraea biroi]|uniref:Uncharacterized protein n=1 Tax=Ooceraea biroi TaxID=2015173 RepID=A0A026W4D7_OOCBI|nr:hypothetical protein X777_10545 [Ooceraea biroi]
MCEDPVMTATTTAMVVTTYRWLLQKVTRPPRTRAIRGGRCTLRNRPPEKLRGGSDLAPTFSRGCFRPLLA